MQDKKKMKKTMNMCEGKMESSAGRLDEIGLARATLREPCVKEVEEKSRYQRRKVPTMVKIFLFVVAEFTGRNEP